MQQLNTTMPLKRNYSDEELFLYTSGPRNARCLLIGEAWGSEEEAAKLPFIGSSGKLLTGLLEEAGLRRDDCLLTNLISARPPGNDFNHFLHPQADKGIVTYEGLKAREPLREGHALLRALIDRVNPRLIIAAGNFPLWAVSDYPTISTADGYKVPSGITSWRGSQCYTSSSKCGARIPLLPIVHPASILREWGLRQPTVQDLRRAARFLGGGNAASWERKNDHFQIHKPSWAQIEQRLHLWKRALQAGPVEIAVDLETFRRKFITVVGLSDSKFSLCIPLVRWNAKRTNLESYLTLGQEQTLWEELKSVLEHPNCKIIGQNFIYDTEWFHRTYNIRALVSHDTMVAHHLLFPGTPKRLDYLASLYCEHYCYWKDESGDWNVFPHDEDAYWKYNCKDTRATYECAQALKGALASQGMIELYAFQMENWLVSRTLCLRGVNFDTGRQKEIRLQLLEEATSLGEWLLSVVPPNLQFTSTGKPWYDSPKGTAHLLYNVLGLRPAIHKKTKRPTTDDAALEELASSAGWLSPLIDRLRHLRSLGVFTRNFLDAKVRADGRMPASFNIAHPETFRWSSNSNGFGEGTNLQNIPKGQE